MIALPTLAIALIVANVQPTPVPPPASPPVASPVPGSVATATPTPGPGSPALPAGTPSPLATAAPTPAPTPAATPQPSPRETMVYDYRYVPRQPASPAPGMPQIFAVYLNSKTLRSQGPIEIKVTTDPGTIKVTSRSNGREGVIPKIAPGDFEANSKLPKIPLIAAGMTVDLEFTALSADGRKVTVRVPVGLK